LLFYRFLLLFSCVLKRPQFILQAQDHMPSDSDDLIEDDIYLFQI
jgi:hypothetical protein